MNQKQLIRMNDVLFRIHKDISAPLFAKNIAKESAYSEQHFHRVFKASIGESFNRYVRQIRLEHAANQLMFESNSNVLNIAQKCGFVSLSSFNKAFKTHFRMTPGQWRSQEKKPLSSPFLVDSEIQAGYENIKSRPMLSPKMVKRDAVLVAYIRHKGYDRSIAQTWEKLRSWAIQENEWEQGLQLGLHHSNPAWVPLKECRYVACISINQPIQRRSRVNQLIIPAGLHAEFSIQGQYGELLPWLNRFLEEWLPNSGYKLKPSPIIAQYNKNHFLQQDSFDIRLCIPVQYV